MRLALGISYNGQSYDGWQSQLSGRTVQDHLETALRKFTTQKVSTVCAGRTDAGVHGLMQVVHFDTPLQREPSSWVRGTNASLPRDIAVQIYNRATHPTLLAKLFSGESIDSAIKWAKNELEGFVR